MTARIGIPRSLAYYSFYPQWKTYLEELGTEVVLSPPTTKDILDQGIKYTVTDACIPIKVFHGHVAALIGQVDYILIPRIVSINGDATLCPKFLGLSDMIRASIKGIPNCQTPMTKPPKISIRTIIIPAIASPLTNLLAPSMAP